MCVSVSSSYRPLPPKAQAGWYQEAAPQSVAAFPCSNLAYVLGRLCDLVPARAPATAVAWAMQQLTPRARADITTPRMVPTKVRPIAQSL